MNYQYSYIFRYREVIMKLILEHFKNNIKMTRTGNEISFLT